MPTVLVPLAQGCEELEVVTIIDMLRRADIHVITAGLDEKPVVSAHQVTFIPDTTLETVLTQNFDMIVLPGGGQGTENLNNDVRIHQLLKTLHAQGKYTAAICAAPKVLATAGLLDDKPATCYPTCVDVKQFPRVQLLDKPVVVTDKVITSRGPGTALDFALQLVELLVGVEKRNAVEAALMR